MNITNTSEDRRTYFQVERTSNEGSWSGRLNARRDSSKFLHCHRWRRRWDSLLMEGRPCCDRVRSFLGLLRLYSTGMCLWSCFVEIILVACHFQKVVVLKDLKNKKSHEDSARVACEAAGSIRIVASLTREDDCVRSYSKSLEGPLRTSTISSIWSTGLYALSQSVNFFVVSLAFWYGAILVSRQEATIVQFFVALMVCILFYTFFID